jgi:excisionase family DNA binding protein
VDEFFTIDEVAQMFKVTRTTVYEWMRSGELAYVQVGARRRVTRSAIDAFVKEGRPEETEEQPANKYSPTLIAA